MRTRFCIWLPFGELVHHETDLTGPCWAKGPGNPEWWKGRAEVLSRFTIPSLRNQKFKFDVFAGIAEETDRQHCKPVLDILEAAGVNIIFHPAHANATFGKSVAEVGVRAVFEDYDNVMFAQMDADDMIASDALELMAEHTPTPGLVLTFRRGYYLNAKTLEMRVYDPGLSPPPFFGRVYTRACLANPEAYETKWRFRVHHQELMESVKRVDLDHDRIVLVCHQRNTMSAWNTILKRGSCKAVVGDQEKADVLRRCGQ